MDISQNVAAYVEAANEFSHVVSTAMLRMARELTELQERAANMNERLVEVESALSDLDT